MPVLGRGEDVRFSGDRLNLKTPEVFNPGVIGRLAQKSGEAPNIPDGVLLHVLPKPDMVRFEHGLPQFSLLPHASELPD